MTKSLLAPVPSPDRQRRARAFADERGGPGTTADRAEHRDDVDVQLLEAAVAAAPVAMCIVDFDGRLVHVNHRYASLLGRAPAELIGQTLAGLTEPDDRMMIDDSLAHMFATGQHPAPYEKRYLR